MTSRRMLLALALFVSGPIGLCEEKAQAPAPSKKDPLEELAQRYKPGHFDSSTFYLVPSSHNDIAYLYDPKGTADFRAESLIGPALDLMKADDSFALDIESTLYLKEFLQRRPERTAEVKQRIKEGRLSFGGAYTQFYEALYGGEALTRQMYFGRKWLKKTLGEGCDTRIVWDTDVPQRTLQGPQVLAKAGIKYLMIGRFPAPGVFLWESPDGSSVMFHTYLYGAGWGVIPGRGGASLATPTDTAKYVFDLLESQRPYFQEHRVANFGSAIMSDYSCPGLELVHTVKAFNEQMEALRKEKGLSPPRMKLGTAQAFMASVEQARPYLKKYEQDWPNPWGYIHQPSHQRMVAAARRGYHYLVNAERFALIANLLDAEDRPYPRGRLNQGWEGLIYPDHGWCGEKALETMRIFKERLRTAHDAGKEVYQSSIAYIARQVRRNKQAGTALIAFNPLSWKRSGPVCATLRFHRGEARPDGLGVADAQGHVLPSQFRAESSYPDGTVREATVLFVAEDVPPIGYKTYYLSNGTSSKPTAGENELRDGVIENRFYRITLGERGVRSLIDKESGAEVFDTQKFLANELFMLGWGTTPAASFDYTFYPENRRIETLEDLGRVSGPMKVEVCESGAVKTVVALTGGTPQYALRQEIALYHQLQRIDFSTELDWKGVRKRAIRLAFPIKTAGNAQTSYDVPFGVVEVGKNEMGSTMPREVQNWVDVGDGERGVTLAVGDTSLYDLRDVTANPWAGPLIQPVLLSTILDLEIPGQEDHPWWTQPGHHQFAFSLTTHPGTWKANWRFGWEFNNPLATVVLRDLEDADVMLDHYTTYDPPAKRTSSPRTHTHGSLPEVYSFGSVEPSHLVISTIKKCEDDEGVVVRYFDMEGKASPAELRFFRPIASAEATNIIEEEGKPVAVRGGALRFDAQPYSIDTVKLALQAPRRKALTLPHSDTMEYADQAAADAMWRKQPGFRGLTLTSEQNHTPGGRSSLKSNRILEFAYLTLPAPTNISIEAWFYDSGDPDAYGCVIAAPSAPTDPTGNAEFGVFPSAQFGGHGGGTTHYTYYTGTGDWARQDSGIARSKGWHKVVFQFAPVGGAIYFDDKLIARSPNLRFARLMFLGNPWVGSKPMFFDDVSVLELPASDRK